MTLNFPNASRSFDATRNLVRFWGYDSALEVSFLVEVSALRKLKPQTSDREADCLATFDAVREDVLEAARRVYSPASQGPYLLAAANF